MCPGPILPIPQISDFFPRFHDFPITPLPPREKKILKDKDKDAVADGAKDRKKEREQEENGQFADSDDEDSEFALALVVIRKQRSGAFELFV